MNLFLIGYRCTGKTSLGRLLAQKIGRSFVDMDDEIVKKTGQSIKTMVSNFSVDTDILRVDEICHMIIERLKINQT